LPQQLQCQGQGQASPCIRQLGCSLAFDDCVSGGTFLPISGLPLGRSATAPLPMPVSLSLECARHRASTLPKDGLDAPDATPPVVAASSPCTYDFLDFKSTQVNDKLTEVTANFRASSSIGRHFVCLVDDMGVFSRPVQHTDTGCAVSFRVWSHVFLSCHRVIVNGLDGSPNLFSLSDLWFSLAEPGFYFFCHTRHPHCFLSCHPHHPPSDYELPSAPSALSPKEQQQQERIL